MAGVFRSVLSKRHRSRIAPPPVSPPSLQDKNTRKLSGGYAVVTHVQGAPRVGSIGCLVTDGHQKYLLTSRHVAGEPGNRLVASVGGRQVELGKVSDKQIGMLPFERLYERWPGKSLVVNVDVALIEVPDVREWSASIFALGQLGPLADLSTQNLSLNVIGCPVRATGGVSGPLEGRVAALFYRYKSIGGREYVADFLIGSRDENPLGTHPGDSGSIWVVDLEDARDPLMPLAIQWGGAVFGNAYESLPFALATNLSNVCRELNVEIVRASYFAQFEYWGAGRSLHDRFAGVHAGNRCQTATAPAQESGSDQFQAGRHRHDCERRVASRLRRAQ